MKILVVLTSHDRPGNACRKTGFRLEEFAAPDMKSQDFDSIYYVGGHGPMGDPSTIPIPARPSWLKTS